MALCLNNLAFFHSVAGRLDESEVEFEEALGLFRRLAAANPEVYKGDMARSIGNLAFLHSWRNRMDVAEREYEEAVSIYRRLFEANPEVYENDVARNLCGLAFLHFCMGKSHLAEKECEDALVIYHSLAEKNTNAGTSNVAEMLLIISGLLDALPSGGTMVIPKIVELMKIYRMCDAHNLQVFAEKINIVSEWLKGHGVSVEQH